MTWHVHGRTGTETRAEERKKNTHTHTLMPSDRRTSRRTHTDSKNAHCASLGEAQEATPGKAYVKQVWQPQLSSTHTHTRTSCHLSPRISGLINNCGGFVSCLSFSCGGVFIQYMSVSVVLPVNTVTQGIQSTHIAAVQSDAAAAEKIKGEHRFWRHWAKCRWVK